MHQFKFIFFLSGCLLFYCSAEDPFTPSESVIRSVLIETPSLSKVPRPAVRRSYALIRSIKNVNASAIYVIGIRSNRLPRNESIENVVIYGCKIPDSPPSDGPNMDVVDGAYFETDVPCKSNQSQPLYMWNANGPSVDHIPQYQGFELGSKVDLNYLVLHVTFKSNISSVPNNSEVSISVNYKYFHPPSLLNVYRFFMRGVTVNGQNVEEHLSCRFLARPKAKFYAARVHSNGHAADAVGVYKIDTRGQWTQILLADPREIQTQKPISPVEINVGDYIMAICRFSTFGRNYTFGTDVRRQEMCNVDLFYSHKWETSFPGNDVCDENMVDAFFHSMDRNLRDEFNAFRGPFDMLTHLPEPTFMHLSDILYNYTRPRIDYRPGFEPIVTTHYQNANSSGLESVGIYGPQFPADHNVLILQSDQRLQYRHHLTLDNFESFSVFQGLAMDPCSNLQVLALQSIPARYYKDYLAIRNGSNEHTIRPALSYSPLLTIDALTGETLVKRGNSMLYPYSLSVDERGFSWVSDVALHQVLMFDARSFVPNAVYMEDYRAGNDDRHFCKPTSVARYIMDPRDLVYRADGSGPNLNDTEWMFVADGVCDANHRAVRVQSGRRQMDLHLQTNLVRRPFALATDRQKQLVCASDADELLVECFDLDSGQLRLTLNLDRLDGKLDGYRVRRMAFATHHPVLYAVLENTNTSFQFVAMFDTQAYGRFMGRLPDLRTSVSTFEIALSLNETLLFVADTWSKSIYTYSIEGAPAMAVNTLLSAEMLAQVLRSCSFHTYKSLGASGAKGPPRNHSDDLKDRVVHQLLILLLSVLSIVTLVGLLAVIVMSRPRHPEYRIIGREFHTFGEFLRAVCFCEIWLPSRVRAWYLLPQSESNRSSLVVPAGGVTEDPQCGLSRFDAYVPHEADNDDEPPIESQLEQAPIVEPLEAKLALETNDLSGNNLNT